MEELNVQENHLGNVIHKDVPSLVVGLIGKFVVKPVELELRQELVQIQHQQMEELNVQENHLRIATHKHVLVANQLQGNSVYFHSNTKILNIKSAPMLTTMQDGAQSMWTPEDMLLDGKTVTPHAQVWSLE